MLAELAGDEAAAALLRDAAQPALGPPLGWLLLEVVASHLRQIPSKFSTLALARYSPKQRSTCRTREKREGKEKDSFSLC